MESILIIALVVSFLYAAALVSTLAFDLVTGRFERLKALRRDMDEAQNKLQRRRNLSEKFWESIPSEQSDT